MVTPTFAPGVYPLPCFTQYGRITKSQIKGTAMSIKTDTSGKRTISGRACAFGSDQPTTAKASLATPFSHLREQNLRFCRTGIGLWISQWKWFPSWWPWPYPPWRHPVIPERPLSVSSKKCGPKSSIWNPAPTPLSRRTPAPRNAGKSPAASTACRRTWATIHSK